MLRLLPDEIQIGLFPDHCWLRKGRHGVVRDYPCLGGGNSDDLLQTLRTMLADPVNALRAGAKVVITVSDSVAALRLLPWQDNLRRQDELQRYAEVLFERAGYDMGAHWVMRVDFCQFRAAGLAFAFRRAWLDEVENIVFGQSMRLVRVLPAAAVAFQLAHPGADGGQRVLLLLESGRVSALVSSKREGRHYDVEPVITASDDAMVRLLRRLQARSGKIAEVAHWSSQPGDSAASGARLKAELPEVVIGHLPREVLC